ncbi:stage II sporulation protein D [Caminicella sporogenes DSM 14501]|uniref:Stage II sporulation protein D n=1 Tax=Caminicella sporogenes DSM 14501 TaxID=1121266 RepID=A0A1M6T472_9FIRM|nr:stage II sporulation protein D [Caminicella sporogenes]RKD25490.1 stage II sporulation protein D [Caminicella sporogenes]WIF95996.1 stage II sporulation protein D [Caminicella sporogenes]SHK51578.1 stage II sporulation protein D [Caminicella sporogenes DSM 14501]
MNDSNEDVLIKVYDNKLKNITKISINKLIPNIVAAQIDIDYEFEVLKVQSIIARTMIIRKAKLFGGNGCEKYKDADICLDGHCIQYLDIESLKSKWGNDFEKNWNKLLKAEEDTKELIITFNNKVIDPKFHEVCGGATENAENVENHKIIYLRKVLCENCKQSLYWNNKRELTIREIEEKLGVKIDKISPIYGPDINGIIEEIERDESGRVVKIKIGDKIFKGTEIIKQLGLDSTRFGWNPVVFRFVTRGKGHGLGLCQYGANEMAKKGKSVREIIEYYYTGVDIKKYEKKNKDKPLSNKVIVIDPGHGGEENTGNIGNNGLMEKDVVLKIALKLSKILKDIGAEVILTRKEDTYVSLNERAKISNKIRPDFFLSIHMNSFGNSSISGTEIYHFRGDKEGEGLSSLIIEKLSEKIGTINKGVKTADFYLLRTVTTTAIHLEVSYITNPEEEKKFMDNYYIDLAAQAIAEGIKEYYEYH